MISPQREVITRVWTWIGKHQSLRSLRSFSVIGHYLFWFGDPRRWPGQPAWPGPQPRPVLICIVLCMKWSDTENLCQAIKRLVKSRTEAVYSDGSGLLKSFIDIIKVQCSQMIDKKFAMRSTSSASLHQNSADVFFLEMIISDQGPGRCRGICIPLMCWACESELGSHVNPEEERIEEMQTNFVQSLAHRALIPNPTALVLPSIPGIRLRLEGRDHGSRCLRAQINYNCIIGGRHKCWPFVLAIVNVRDEGRRDREDSAPSSHHQAWPRAGVRLISARLGFLKYIQRMNGIYRI